MDRQLRSVLEELSLALALSLMHLAKGRINIEEVKTFLTIS
jgi:hypothetical protein